MASAQKDQKQKKSTPAEPDAIMSIMSDPPSTAGAAAFPKPSTGQAVIVTLPPLPASKLDASPTPSLATLQFLKETQELEIKKLELQLHVHNTCRPSSGTHSRAA